MAGHLVVPNAHGLGASRTMGRSVPQEDTPSSPTGSTLPCVFCGVTRRYGCNKQGPPCQTCAGLHQTCTYDWKIGEQIYKLFRPDMILNGRLKIKLSELAHHPAYGGAARVHRTGDKETGMYAVKMIFENRDVRGRQLELAAREAWTWYQLGRHENIIELTGIANLREISTNGYDQLCLVSPWMEAGHITHYVNSNPGVNRIRLLWDIVKGVQYLHSPEVNVIHGDLKGNNVLIDTSGPFPRARLTDFGASFIRDTPDVLEEGLSSLPSSSRDHWGNVRWMAFERLSPKTFGAKNGKDAFSQASDVFEMMRTFLEVLTGKAPFQEVMQSHITVHLLEGKNPVRPQGRIDGLDDTMWQLMEKAWCRERNKRVRLDEIYDELEARVMSEAVRCETTYLDALNFTSTAIERFCNTELSSSRRAGLLDYLTHLLSRSPDTVYRPDSDGFGILLTSVIDRLPSPQRMEFLLSDSEHAMTDLALGQDALIKSAFSFIAEFARFAWTRFKEAWSILIGRRLPLAVVASGLLHDLLAAEDFEDVLQLFHWNLRAAGAKDATDTLDDILLLMAETISMSRVPHVMDQWWTRLIMQDLIQEHLVMRSEEGKDDGAVWPDVFAKIVAWLKQKCGIDIEFKAVLGRLLSSATLSKILSHSSRSPDVELELTRAATILELRDDFRPMNLEDVQTILPMLSEYVESRSEFDDLKVCMRLLGLQAFQAGIVLFMTSASLPVMSTMDSLCRILRLAAFRLIANPLDPLFPALAPLPWTTLIQVVSGITTTQDDRLMGVLDTLSIAYTRLGWKQDDPSSRQGRRDLVDQYKQQALMPLIARYLIASEQRSNVSLCVRLITSKGSVLGASLVEAFTTVNIPDDLFMACCRIWYWSYSQPRNDVEGVLSQWLLSHIGLEAQISNVLNQQLPTARLSHLLRILAQRLDLDSSRGIGDRLVPPLLLCIKTHAACEWVASPYPIIDMVRNETVLLAAFSVLQGRIKSNGFYPKSHAMAAIVAAYRVTHGKNALIRQQLPKLESSTLKALLTEVVEHDWDAAIGWEFALYRLMDLSGLSAGNRPGMLLRLFNELAMVQIRTDNDGAAYISLLVLQQIYRCLGANLNDFLSSLPSNMSTKLPTWIAQHEAETAAILKSLPLTSSAAETIVPQGAAATALASFRRLMEAPVYTRVPSLDTYSTSASSSGVGSARSLSNDETRSESPATSSSGSRLRRFLGGGR